MLDKSDDERRTTPLITRACLKNVSWRSGRMIPSTRGRPCSRTGTDPVMGNNAKKIHENIKQICTKANGKESSERVHLAKKSRRYVSLTQFL